MTPASAEGVSLWCIWVLYKGFLLVSNKEEEDAQLIWNFLILTILGVLLIVAAALGIAAAKHFSLPMLLCYFWASIFLLAPLMIFSVSCFTFQKVRLSHLSIPRHVTAAVLPQFSLTWLKHRWHNVQLREVRRRFCNPQNGDELRAEHGKLWSTNGVSEQNLHVSKSFV